VETVPVTVVADEFACERVLDVLREAGIDGFAKRTDFSAGAALGAGGAGPFEIWVSEGDAARAQELLGEL
jgi:hypothetical protein